MKKELLSPLLVIAAMILVIISKVGDEKNRLDSLYCCCNYYRMHYGDSKFG